MHAQRSGWSKVHTRRSSRDLMVAEQHSTPQFEVRLKSPASREVPLQSQRIEPRPVRRVVALEDHKHRYRVQRVLESSIEESGPVRLRQYPAITKAQIPNACVRRAPRNRMPTARPYLDFMATILGPCLRPSNCTEPHQRECDKKFFHSNQTGAREIR